MNPDTTLYDAKRMIGKKFSDPEVQEMTKTWPFSISEGVEGRPQFNCTTKTAGASTYYAEEISAMVLEKLKNAATDKCGKQVTK